jgi:hypothetical protein
MIRKYLTIFALLNLGIYSSAYAYSDNESYISCPQQILCSEDNNISSCNAMGNNLQYWNSTLWREGNVIRGYYLFNHVEATFQSSEVSNPICYYTLINNGHEERMRLGAVISRTNWTTSHAA